MADPRVGSIVDGRYRVVERLAAGGTGIVYVGTQLGLNRAVALKFLHKSSAQSRTHAGRFEREARVMSQLAHPNIAQIIDFGSDQDGNYLVMELCKGVSLRDVLTDGPMDLHRATRIARQVLAGLAHAHDANIVHRDLKPGNVLLLDSQGDEHLKILDFGVAKIMSSDGPTELSVAARGPLGTPHYMSPEQATSQAVDARTDIYSLGVMLYEMTTGKRPFDAGVGFALLRQHVEDAAKPPGEVREMSPQLEGLILRAMEKEPDARFQTAAEMMEALARVPEAIHPNARPARRRRALVAGLTFATLAIVAGVGWYGTTRGWFVRPLPGVSTQVVALTGPARPAPRAARPPAARAKAALPPWRPPAASVILPSLTRFPTIDNRTLAGKLDGKPFKPRFAVVYNDGGTLLLRLTEAVPQTRFCSDLRWADLGAPQLSLTLPALPKENEPLRSRKRSSVLVSADESRKILRVRWWVRFDKLDPDAQIGVGRIRIDGRKVRLRGNFIAAYCPGPGVGNAIAQVNTVAWDAARAPDPDGLPIQAIAGAFAQKKIALAHVSVSREDDPARTTLTFFARTPTTPCSVLGDADVGAAVTLPGATHQDLSLSSLLPVNPTGAQATAIFHVPNKCTPASADCPPVTKLRASALSIRVDAELTGELRGRIYLAAPGAVPTLLAGAFRARDCRKAEPVRVSQPSPIDGGAGSAVDAHTAGNVLDAGIAVDAAADANTTGAAGPR